MQKALDLAKHGGDAPGHGLPGVQAGGLAVRLVNILF